MALFYGAVLVGLVGYIGLGYVAVLLGIPMWPYRGRP